MMMSKESTSVKAKIVRWNQAPCLLVSFPKNPQKMVWSFNLDEAKNVLLALQEKEGEWDIGYKKPAEAFTAVAHFDDYDDALAAYKALQKAMFRGPVAWSMARVFKNVLFGALLVVLVWMLAMSVFNGVTSLWKGEGGVVTTSAEKASDATSAGEVQFGVPMDADSILPPVVQ